MCNRIERNSFLISTKFKTFSKVIDNQQLLSIAAITQNLNGFHLYSFQERPSSLPFGHNHLWLQETEFILSTFHLVRVTTVITYYRLFVKMAPNRKKTVSAAEGQRT